MKDVYTNPQTVRTIQDFPMGSVFGLAMFYVEFNDDGTQRGVARTVDPLTLKMSKPHTTNSYRRVRFVDGTGAHDGDIFIIGDRGEFITVWYSDARTVKERIRQDDPRFAEMKALFDIEEVA